MIVFNYISHVGIFTKTILFIPVIHACATFIMANTSKYPMNIKPELYGVIAAISIPTLIFLLISTINFTIFLRENNPFSNLPFVSSVTHN